MARHTGIPKLGKYRIIIAFAILLLAIVLLSIFLSNQQIISATVTEGSTVDGIGSQATALHLQGKESGHHSFLTLLNAWVLPIKRKESNVKEAVLLNLERYSKI